MVKRLLSRNDKLLKVKAAVFFFGLFCLTPLTFASEAPAVLKITSDWGSGFNGDITVKNTTDKTIESWKIEFDFSHNINNIWNAKISSHSNNHYVIENLSWNGKLASGQSTSFGFGGSPGNVTSDIENIKLNGIAFSQNNENSSANNNSSSSENSQITENETTPVTVKGFEYKVTSDWGSGFNGDMKVTNTTSSKSDGWKIEFDYPYEITSLWNAQISSYTENHYIIENLSWNKELAQNQSVSFGFGGKPGNATALPSNVKMYFNSNVVQEEVNHENKENGGSIENQNSQNEENKSEKSENNTTESPTAADDSFYVLKNESKEIDVLANDNGSDLSINSISKPEHGTASIAGGKVIYTPDSDFIGNDSFEYTIKNASGLLATGLVFLTVNESTVTNINKVNATYWCAWGGNTSYNISGKQIQSSGIEMDKIDPSYNVIITAFIITDSNGNYVLSLKDPGSTAPSLYSEAQVKEFISKTKAQGKKVIVSLGGEKFHMVMKTSSDSAHFVNQVKKIIDEYGFDGIDLDLEGSVTTSANPELLGDAVLQVINYYRNSNRNFWLTAAPEWCYVIPYTYGTGEWASRSLQNDFYVKLFNKIGIDNFTYVWPQLYNQGPANGVTGFNKTKVSPVEGMDKFMSAVAWGISTQEGYKANGSLGVFIPADKLCLGIPATEGAAGGEMLYIATPELIKSAINLMQQQNSPISGFMNWSVDWDALNIADGQLSVGYIHTAWATGKAVSAALNINPDNTAENNKEENNTSSADNDSSSSNQNNSSNENDNEENSNGGTAEIQNNPPAIVFNAPVLSNLKQENLSSVTISVSAGDSDGTVTAVQISVDNKIFNTSTANWTPSHFGSFTIVATATDNKGSVTTKEYTVNIEQTDSTVVKRQIIGYFTQWDAWKGTNEGFPVKGFCNQLNIDYSKYTMLNFSFFGVAKDGSLHSADFANKQLYLPDAVQEPAPILNGDVYSSWDYWLLYGELELLWEANAKAVEAGFVVTGTNWYNTKTGLSGSMPIPMPKEGGAKGLMQLCKENNVKLIATIGGWSMGKHIPEMAADPTKKLNFLNDCKKLMNMGFDGIDIDWEYPGPFSGMNYTGTNADFANFTALMRDIRYSIGSDKLLIAAFSCSPERLAGFNWNELDQYMDYFNIMSYDINGGWSEKTGHNSPLYGDGLSWNTTYEYLTKVKKVPAHKINMGLGFYGRGLITNGNAGLDVQTVKSSITVQPDGPIVSASDLINWGNFGGSPNYTYIMHNTKDWAYNWDDKAKVPYLTKDNYFLTYDNEASIQYKADFIIDKGLGGVIVWQVFGDINAESVETIYANKLPYSSNITTPLLDVLHYTFTTNGEASHL